MPHDDWLGPYRAHLNADGLFEAVPDRRGPGSPASAGTHDSPGAIDMGMGIIAHPGMPKDRILLVAHNSPLDLMMRSAKPIWREDPFDRSRIPRGVYDSERAKALDFLAGLLDDWCEDMGLDPDETWRNPRIREREARRNSAHLHFVMDERISLAIHRDISAVIKVVP